tara:strand:- start:2799 stop:2984 length:186 start_codon:yes stop_codon:yes gene_type:complete
MIIVYPFALNAEQSDSLINEDIEISKENESTLKMSQEEMDNLFGPDPYLGPTSWLDSKQDN